MYINARALCSQCAGSAACAGAVLALGRERTQAGQQVEAGVGMSSCRVDLPHLHVAVCELESARLIRTQMKECAKELVCPIVSKFMSLIAISRHLPEL